MTLFMLITSCSSDNSSPIDVDGKLATPSLLSPSNNSTVEVYLDLTDGLPEETYFQWSEVSNASLYIIQISKTSSFENIEFESISSFNHFYIRLDEFEQESIYYWRVKAIGQSFEDSDFSQVFSFLLFNYSCEFCQNYSVEGIFNAIIDGENVSNRTIDVRFQPYGDNLYQSLYNFDFGSFNNWYTQLSFLYGPLQNGNTLIYENIIWIINGTTLTINGTATFDEDFETITGDLTLTGSHTGSITFFVNL